MDTVTKLAQPHSAERVLEALSTLAALLDRTIHEVKNLDGEFQERMLQAVHDTEASLQEQAAGHIDQARAEVQQRIRSEITEQLREQFEIERKAAIEAFQRELESERDKFNRELDRATQAASLWESERSRLYSERDRLAADLEQERLRAVPQAAAQPADNESLGNEIQRVEDRIRQIAALIDDPATDLSMVIRKNVERTELDSYLKGIRFAINGQSKK